MAKRVGQSQELGRLGEDTFRFWTNKIGWFPNKIENDFGFDFMCQIRGEKTDQNSSEMTGNLLMVSVRSTKSNGKTVTIDRNDAKLLLETTIPMVFALVRRDFPKEEERVAIQFPDEKFIRELTNFLRSQNLHHKLRFSDATLNFDEIRCKVESLYKEFYPDKMARLRAQLRLEGILPNTEISILHRKEGSYIIIQPNSFSALIENEQPPDVTDALKDIGPFKILRASKNYGFEVTDNTQDNAKIPNLERDHFERNQTLFDASDDIKRLASSKLDSSISHLDSPLKMAESLRHELSVWNYKTAIDIAIQLETSLTTTKPASDHIPPEIWILLARAHINWSETNPSESKYNIEHAKTLLSKVDPLLVDNVAWEAEVTALKASLENSEKGLDAALLLLDGRTDPYAIRARTGLLLNHQKTKEALNVIKDLIPHERWCDVAVTAYVLNDELDKAQELVQWAATLTDRSHYSRCIVRMANAMMIRASVDLSKGINILSPSITPLERKRFETIIETLHPVLQLIQVARRPTSELDMTALQIAWRANHLLQNRETMTELMILMLEWTPLPLDVARGVVSGYIDAPLNLPDRLRQDYPGDFEAGILALVIQTGFLNQHKEAYIKAKELLPLADNEQKKEELFIFFQEILQNLDVSETSECEAIAGSLVMYNPRLHAQLEGEIALRNGEVDKAIDILEGQETLDDIVWLQLRANASLKKKQIAEAVEFLILAAKRNPEPGLLIKTGELAYQVDKIDIAVWCFEKLAEIQPRNVNAHYNLARIYAVNLNNPEKAAIQFQSLYEIEPGNLLYKSNLAACLAQLFRYKESLILYDDLCRQESPPFRAILGRAQVLHSLGDPEKALASLLPFRSRFWDTPDFLMAYLMIAHAAGKDEEAHEALMVLNKLSEQGAIEPEKFRLIHTEEALELFKQSFSQTQDRNQIIHKEMLIGHTPWVLAEQMSNNPIYWGWRKRTQKVGWIYDEPANRARLSIYTTNGFHVRESKLSKHELLPLRCPSSGTKVVADISALITLHRLGLLNAVAEYFGEVLVPMGYLPSVLEESQQMVLIQRSQRENVERIARQIETGHILVLKKDSEAISTLPVIDEYAESDTHRYRLVDFIQPLYVAGILNEDDFSRISPVCTKPSAVDEAHPALIQSQQVIANLTTLETIANLGFIDAFVEFYCIAISNQAHREVLQRIEDIASQEETRNWHIDLWSNLRSDNRFHFVPHIVPEKMRRIDIDGKNHLAFLASFISLEIKIPLLVDDRVCQVLILNEIPSVTYAAFGSDLIVLALFSSGKLEPKKAASAIKQLMAWRYRFIIPTPDIIKVLADTHRGNPPGRSLYEVAEYVHDCMRDPGLFGGAEQTELGESMAMRLYQAWLHIIAEFLILVWADKGFTIEAAVQITKWSCSELLPSWPRVADGRKKIHGAQITPRVFLSYAILKTVDFLGEPRMAEAMKALKEGLHLTDEEYLKIVVEILNITSRKTPSSSNQHNAFRAIQMRIRNYTLRQFDHIDHRSLIALQNLNLTDKIIIPTEISVDLEVLRDPSHPRRLKLSPGPLLIYLTKDEEPKHVLIEVSTLLYSELLEVRKAAFSYLNEQATEGTLAITPKTKSILEKSRFRLLSDDTHEWKQSAIELNDTLNDDFFVALQGVKQILGCDSINKESLNSYVPRVLYPTLSSINSIALEVRNPSKEHLKLKEIISFIIGAAVNLNDACEKYNARLGYLPLEPQYSMGEVVARWMVVHPKDDVWAEVWNWAHSAFGPIPQYHACAVFILHPELVPTEKIPDLWREILAVVIDTGNKTVKCIEPASWIMRRDLARHYAYHLEANLPDNDGDNIACFAWWLTEQVATLFPDEPQSAQFYSHHWIKSALSKSTHIWLSASSHIGRSFFRYVTVSIRSPWSMALLALMGINLERLTPEKQTPEIQALFNSALLYCIFDTLPISTGSNTDFTYAVEFPLGVIALKWAASQPEEHRKALEQLIETSQTLGTIKGIALTLRNIVEKSLPDQLAIAFALKTKIYRDPTEAGEIWEILSNMEWRQQVFNSIDEQVLGLLIEAFSILQVWDHEMRVFLLPHYIAEICEKSENDDRQRLLFMYVIHTSMVADTVSALRRLLHGSKKTKFTQYVKEYRTLVETIWSYYPAWVQGRLRGLLASLHVV